MATKDEDAVTELFVTSTHTPVLFFSTLGKVYRMKVWRLPEGGPATRGRPKPTTRARPWRWTRWHARSRCCSAPPVATGWCA